MRTCVTFHYNLLLIIVDDAKISCRILTLKEKKEMPSLETFQFQCRGQTRRGDEMPNVHIRQPEAPINMIISRRPQNCIIL